MGFLTTKAKVWYPAITDKMQLHTLFATLASSIENGLQPRLERQEIAVGLKASLSTPWNLPATAQTVPYTISTGAGDFNSGFTFSNGVATVQTSGMYVVTAAIASTNVAGKSVGITLMKNSTEFGGSEVATQASWYISAQGSCVVNCVPGDTLYAQGFTTPTAGQTTAPRQSVNYLSIAMVQANPL